MISLEILFTSPFTFATGIIVIKLIIITSTFALNDICWPFNIVPYKIDPHFDIHEQTYIKEQIAKINNNTCVYWSDMDESKDQQNVSSFVSFVGGKAKDVCQTDWHLMTEDEPFWVEVKLTPYCFKERIVLHEIVHALGFYHEHQRIDRDCYVSVSETAKENPDYTIYQSFAIFNIDRFPYDKESVMHYPRTSEMKALSERWYWWEPLGNDGDVLSELDLWKIQYRFCGRPHYCEVHPQHCTYMERMESDMNCNVQA